MQQQPLAQPIRYHSPYVLPASVLSDEPTHDEDPSNLRADASHNGVCYLWVTRSFHDGTYLARVASQPDLVPTHGFTVVLSEVQLAQAHPWDYSFQGADQAA
jgi:hypothetical protein